MFTSNGGHLTITKIIFRLILNDFKEILYSFWWRDDFVFFSFSIFTVVYALNAECHTNHRRWFLNIVFGLFDCDCDLSSVNVCACEIQFFCEGNPLRFNFKSFYLLPLQQLLNWTMNYIRACECSTLRSTLPPSMIFKSELFFCFSNCV